MNVVASAINLALNEWNTNLVMIVGPNLIHYKFIWRCWYLLSSKQGPYSMYYWEL